MRKSIVLSTGLIFGMFVTIFAQHPTYPIIKTNEAQQLLLKTNPQLELIQNSVEKKQGFYHQSNLPTKKRIGLIFHILYSSSEEKVSEEQIQSQIDALNRDFNMILPKENHPSSLSKKFQKRSSEPDISFCLANLDISNKNAEAIHYVPTEKVDWDYNNHIKSKNTSGANPIAPSQYLNIWVAHMADTVGGYAQMPGGPMATDGIVIDYRFFGTMGTAVPPFDEGKTLTHLVGNYLNLYSLWGKSRCQDDGVADTPIHNSFNWGCPKYKHFTSCPGEEKVEMVMNFMDSTVDSCRFMFTQGQKMRMHAVLEPHGSRAQLVQGKVKCPEVLEETLFRSKDFESEMAIHQLDFTVYPNPASKMAFININTPSQNRMLIKAINAIGEVVFLQEFEAESGSSTLQVNCQNWSPGLYFFELVSGETKLIKKLMVSHH